MGMSSALVFSCSICALVLSQVFFLALENEKQLYKFLLLRHSKNNRVRQVNVCTSAGLQKHQCAMRFTLVLSRQGTPLHVKETGDVSACLTLY